MNKILNKYKTNKNFVIKLDIEGEEINCLKNINNSILIKAVLRCCELGCFFVKCMGCFLIVDATYC